jgi:hypothetical protein
MPTLGVTKIKERTEGLASDGNKAFWANSTLISNLFFISFSFWDVISFLYVAWAILNHFF